MDAPEQPQIYLITPPTFELSTFPDRLARVLDAGPVACVRLTMSSRDEEVISKAADALREITHARHVALVISEHLIMVDRLGLDGVHLLDASKSVRYTRKELGEDAIIGSFCGTSRHDGLTAGEAGADYISFGPIGSSLLGDGSTVEQDVFEWWSDVVEVPCVAEGALDADLIRTLASYTDFFGIGDEIWGHDDAAAALENLRTAMR
jgi:thiamine-phosphate pyrophosphorylase